MRGIWWLWGDTYVVMGYISGGLLAYMDILVLFQEAFTALLLWAAFTAASTASWTTITSGGLYVCTRVSVTFQAAARHRYRSGGIPYRESCTNVYVYIDIILGALTFCAGTARRFRSVWIKLKFKHLKSRCKYVSSKDTVDGSKKLATSHRRYFYFLFVLSRNPNKRTGGDANANGE